MYCPIGDPSSILWGKCNVGSVLKHSANLDRAFIQCMPTATIFIGYKFFGMFRSPEKQ